MQRLPTRGLEPVRGDVYGCGESHDVEEVQETGAGYHHDEERNENGARRDVLEGPAPLPVDRNADPFSDHVGQSNDQERFNRFEPERLSHEPGYDPSRDGQPKARRHGPCQEGSGNVEGGKSRLAGAIRTADANGGVHEAPRAYEGIASAASQVRLGVWVSGAVARAGHQVLPWALTRPFVPAVTPSAVCPGPRAPC